MEKRRSDSSDEIVVERNAKRTKTSLRQHDMNNDETFGAQSAQPYSNFTTPDYSPWKALPDNSSRFYASQPQQNGAYGFVERRTETVEASTTTALRSLAHVTMIAGNTQNHFTNSW